MAQGRGRKLNQVKNERAHAEFMEGKKFGRKKQVFVWTDSPLDANMDVPKENRKATMHRGYGHWEKV
jgi:hypothetical protein